jgi:putative oxidoreductase
MGWIMKKLLRWLLTTSPLAADLGLLVMRLYVGGLLAFAHGVDKMRNLDAFVVQVDALKMPSAQVLAVCAALAEFVGGILLTLGLLGRGAAAAVMVTMGVAVLQVHSADPFARKELAIVYGLGALALVLAGPGRISLDHLFFGRGNGKAAGPAGKARTDGPAPRTTSTADWPKPAAPRPPAPVPVPPPIPPKRDKASS